ncbi:hypothetical protein AKJ16_DCAP01445 [Drosera capensis]
MDPRIYRQATPTVSRISKSRFSCLPFSSDSPSLLGVSVTRCGYAAGDVRRYLLLLTNFGFA